MATAELVTLERYLHTSFEHDAEFVEGRIVERPGTSFEHSSMQGFLLEELRTAHELGWRTMIELRVQTRPDRIRVPDVCIVTGPPDPESNGIITRPPHLCVEILAPEDTAVEMLEKIREYLGFGVEWVWLIYPASLTRQVHSRNAGANIEDRIFSTDRFNIDLSGAEI